MMDWIHSHIPAWVWIAIVAHLVVLLTVAYLILLERKVAAWVQDRVGPNRVGLGFGIVPILKNWRMAGLGQPMADGLKFLLKEDFRPKGADAALFTIAPAIMMIVAIVSIAVIPWGGVKQTAVPAGTHIPPGVTVVVSDAQSVTYRYPFQIANLNIGVLYVVAVLSLGVYGVVVGGWASNNKFSFLGALRATANMISYEIPLGLSILCIVLMYGTLDLATIVQRQTHLWLGVVPAWNVFTQPLAFVLFLVCIHAEANRAPFDLAEAEQELVGGYHTEYSSMRFAFFFLAEYAGMITTSLVCVALFFGGWHIPYLTDGRVDPTDATVTSSLALCVARGAVFYLKAMAVIVVFMWVRWSLPRFRFDQLMHIAWRGLIPISLALAAGTALAVYWLGGTTVEVVGFRAGVVLVAMNLIVLIGTFTAARVLPSAPDTNRRIHVPGSRFSGTPLEADAN
ncbi:MAG: NADH-quinone oxidoreductase subunit NuoH [Tepidisphaeraceae bacterium]